MIQPVIATLRTFALLDKPAVAPDANTFAVELPKLEVQHVVLER